MQYKFKVGQKVIPTEEFLKNNPYWVDRDVLTIERVDDWNNKPTYYIGVDLLAAGPEYYKNFIGKTFEVVLLAGNGVVVDTNTNTPFDSKPFFYFREIEKIVPENMGWCQECNPDNCSGCGIPDNTAIVDYEAVLREQNELVAKLDSILNGKDAALAPSLCDLVSIEEVKASEYKKNYDDAMRSLKFAFDSMDNLALKIGTRLTVEDECDMRLTIGLLFDSIRDRVQKLKPKE